jgi:glycerophosphoryl diester phosphodiesterase
VIDLYRRDGRPLVVGHRGAPGLAPENTLASFAAAVELGVDLIELDVLALEGGPLVVAHSDRLEEVTHGAAQGRVGSMSLGQLRELAPGLPTFAEALDWFADAAPCVGLHVDLKLRGRLDEAAQLLEGRGLAARTVVSSPNPDALRRVAQASSRIRLGLTYPEDRLQVSRWRPLQPAIRATLSAARATVPLRVPPLLRSAGAGALMLQHRLVSAAAVARAHAVGCPLLVWTVDEPDDVRRVLAAGVDAVITNDPGQLLATLAA